MAENVVKKNVILLSDPLISQCCEDSGPFKRCFTYSLSSEMAHDVEMTSDRIDVITTACANCELRRNLGEFNFKIRPK